MPNLPRKERGNGREKTFWRFVIACKLFLRKMYIVRVLLIHFLSTFYAVRYNSDSD